MITLDIPVRIVSEANQREHGLVTHRRKKRQQADTARCLHTRERPPLPCRVTLERHGRGMMDTDNCVGGFKHVRDKIAEWLGCGDSPADPIEWVYAPQVRTGNQEVPSYWIRVTIEATDA